MKQSSVRTQRYTSKHKNPVKLLLFLLPALIALAGIAGNLGTTIPLHVIAGTTQSNSGASLWTDVDEKSIPSAELRQIIPDRYRTVNLNRGALEQFLKTVSLEFTDASRKGSAELSLPMPYGGYQRFAVVESPIMESALAAKFPEIKTYRGQGIDDPTATLRFDVTSAGFHALVLSSEDSIYIDPYAKGDLDNYISYYKRDYKSAEQFSCLVSDDKAKSSGSSGPVSQNPSISNGQTLRTFRLAVAATGEYTQSAGGTVPSALAAITTVINRVDGIYERDLAVRLVLIANNNLIIYTNAATDPYTTNLDTILQENQTNLDTVIGPASYDVGQVFGNLGAGIGWIGSVCMEDDPFYHIPTKGRGLSSGSGTGDSFAVAMVSHELGHQFGASHSFNATSSNCGDFLGRSQRAAGAAYEPGSGSTIMSYGGLCYPQNYVPTKEDYFLVASLERMLGFIGTLSCPTSTNTMNQPPSVNAGPNHTIPKGTPFTLTAACNDPLHCDPNDDPVTYSWEEYDLGSPSPPDSDGDNFSRPIFRSYQPTSSKSRTFPALHYVQDSASTPGFDQTTSLIPGEALPLITRTMNFQVTARDNRSNGGGVSSSSTQVNITASSGPFFVTAPNTALTLAPGSQPTVTWNVANTNLPPVSCQNVNILLSTDGGNTYLPTPLAANTANDGSEMVMLPSITATAARVRVEAVGNVFFDISDTNFMIVPSSCTYTLNKLSRSVVYGQGSYNVTVTTGTCSWQAKSNVPWISVPSTTFTGTNSFLYTVQGNYSGCSRVGTISVAGQTHTVTQDPTCSATISSLSESYAFSGGSGKVDVVVSDPTTCNWTASSNAPWITIISGKGTLGNGTLLYNVAANSATGSRSGTLSIAGYTFTVTQYGANAGSSTTQATFVRTDGTTQGNWRGVYGADGFNVISDTASYPGYAQATASGNFSFIWSNPSGETRALQKAVGTDRIAACWYNPDTFSIDVNLTDGCTHQVAIYCMDNDYIRTQRVSVVDQATSAVLDSRDVVDFGNGQYLIWSVKGHVVIKVAKIVNYNGVVSGIFFDTPGGGCSSASVTYVTTDATTQGNWQSGYGADGYNVINDSVSYPSYATVNPTGHAPFTWTASTTDIRALQKVANPSDRIAANWYAATFFNIELNVSDTSTHQVALYCLDWDVAGRSQKIEIFDATTNALLDTRNISSFSGGLYMVWNIKGHVNIKLTRLAGANSVVSGIFFGGPRSRVNVALASNGATATASSTYNSNYPASGAINGDRKGLNWGNGGGWADGTDNVFPDWIQVNFSGSKTINEIDVFTVQDDDAHPVEPTPTLTFSIWGITDFSAQYWNGSNWITVPNGSVSGNNKVWRQFTFANITTDRIRIFVTNALWSNSRITEVEAYASTASPPTNVALASNGATVTASSTYNSNYPASGAINGDRKGLNWSNGGGWADGTDNVFPDWIQVNFSGSKTINEIDVFTVQDDDAHPVEPTPTLTFSIWGITDFSAQYWNGFNWIIVPNGSVSGNNKVWRQFTFANITTDRIRIFVTNALWSNSRITEVEAYSSGG